MITKAMAMRMVAIFTVATVLFDDQNAARRTSVISDEQQKFDVRKVSGAQRLCAVGLGGGGIILILPLNQKLLSY